MSLRSKLKQGSSQGRPFYSAVSALSSYQKLSINQFDVIKLFVHFMNFSLVDNAIGQPVLRKPEPFVKVNNPSNNRPFKPVPTSLTLTRDKISFTLNHGPTQKKNTISVSEQKTQNTGKSDEPENPVSETSSLVGPKSDALEKKPCCENTVQVNDITSSVEDKLGKDNGDTTKQNEAAVTKKPQEKDEKSMFKFV